MKYLKCDSGLSRKKMYFNVIKGFNPVIDINRYQHKHGQC